MQQNGKAQFAGQTAVLVSKGYETDEWGNVLERTTSVWKGNKVLEVASLTRSGGVQLDSMTGYNQRETLSRTAFFDETTQVTTIQNVKIIAYADSGTKRLQCDAQSTVERITAHPDFQNLAGTPDDPKEEDALWLDSNDAAGTKKFIEFKLASLKGVSQYIAGNGSSLKITYFCEWSEFASRADEIGKIATPLVNGVWGFTNSWLLAGATAEPFGERWKVTLVYKNASENFGQYDGAGWSTKLYT